MGSEYALGAREEEEEEEGKGVDMLESFLEVVEGRRHG